MHRAQSGVELPLSAVARARLLAISASGRDALTRFTVANRALLDKALAGWTDEALSALAALLQRLVRDLRRGGPDEHARAAG